MSQSTGLVTTLQAYLHELKFHNAFVPCNLSLCAFVMQEYSKTTCSLKVYITVVDQFLTSTLIHIATQLCVHFSFCKTIQ